MSSPQPICKQNDPHDMMSVVYCKPGSPNKAGGGGAAQPPRPLANETSTQPSPTENMVMT